MGKAQSKYIFNPPKVDPIFRDIGCIGLKRDDYKGDDAGKLAAPPFLYYRFTAKTYRDLQLEISKIFQSISPSTEAPEIEDTSFLNITPATEKTVETFNTEDIIEHFVINKQNYNLQQIVLQKKQSTQILQNNITGNKNVYGPVYFLVAQDSTNKSFEGFLYFPSMRKNKTRYRNYIELGISHRWMHTLLYSRTYARTPVELIAKKREHTKCETYNYSLQKQENKTRDKFKNFISGLFNVSKFIMVGDPIKYGCRTNTSSNDTNIARACMESEEILKEQGTFKDGSGYHKDTDMDYGTDVISSEKAYYPAVYYHTYQIDTSKPSFAPYMNNAGFDNLQLNILVSDLDMYYGCNYMLISPNNRIMLNLNKNMFALFINSQSINTSKVIVKSQDRLNRNLELLLQKLNIKRNFPPLKLPSQMQTDVSINTLDGAFAFPDLKKACYDNPKLTDGLLILKKFNIKGNGNRYVIENKTLNVYTLDEGDIEDIGYSIEVVDTNSESQPPYALLLDNTGRLRVYDNNDKEVTSPKLTQAFAYNGQPDENGLININQNKITDKNDIEQCFFNNEGYNAAKNYRCRLLNLIAYLQFKGLLKDLIGFQNNENPDENIQQFKIIYEKVAIYNSSEDYVRRIIELVDYIEKHYETTIDENIISSYYDNKNTTNEKIKKDQNNYDKVPQYNNSNDSKQRIVDLKNYMKSYNILKEDSLYNEQALEEQSKQLPLTSQLDHEIPQYNKNEDYEKRLMNLQSYYPIK